jgi:hypothetical protein
LQLQQNFTACIANLTEVLGEYSLLVKNYAELETNLTLSTASSGNTSASILCSNCPDCPESASTPVAVSSACLETESSLYLCMQQATKAETLLLTSITSLSTSLKTLTDLKQDSAVAVKPDDSTLSLCLGSMSTLQTLLQQSSDSSTSDSSSSSLSLPARLEALTVVSAKLQKQQLELLASCSGGSDATVWSLLSNQIAYDIVLPLSNNVRSFQHSVWTRFVCFPVLLFFGTFCSLRLRFRSAVFARLSFLLLNCILMPTQQLN